MIYSTSPDNCRTSGLCGNIKVDINGTDGEYTLGKDVFIFNITDKGIIPSGMKDTTLNQSDFERYCDRDGSTNANGQACAAWVVYNENLDYTKCDDLSWSEKLKCD